MLTLVHLKINNQTYIIDALKVKYIINNSDLNITSIPDNTDPSTLGWFKYQNVIYTIKNGSTLLGFDDITEKKSVILLSNEIGLIVDSVSNVELVDDNVLLPSPVKCKYVSKVQVDGDKLYLMLDI